MTIEASPITVAPAWQFSPDAFYPASTCKTNEHRSRSTANNGSTKARGRFDIPRRVHLPILLRERPPKASLHSEPKHLRLVISCFNHVVRPRFTVAAAIASVSPISRPENTMPRCFANVPSGCTWDSDQLSLRYRSSRIACLRASFASLAFLRSSASMLR